MTDAISVDMGCVGEGLDLHRASGLHLLPRTPAAPTATPWSPSSSTQPSREQADFAVDVYPHYGSDVEATLSAGYDIRHGLIGAGVYASHGYERSHIDGVMNTLKVLKGFLHI